MKFIGLNVKAFYYNLVLTPASLESRFKAKIIKFTCSSFIKYLDMVSSGADISVRLTEYDKILYVFSISKYVCENPAMSNFGISQVNFDMHLLHWIFVKILYKKRKNWGRADDNDLYLMWILTNDQGVDWVKFIINRIIHCRDNPKRILNSTSQE